MFMNQNITKKASRLALVLLLAATTFSACNNGGDKKKEEAPKVDTPAPPPPAETKPTGPDTTGQGGDTLKQKPTAPGD
jgi:hypothetical protein